MGSEGEGVVFGVVIVELRCVMDDGVEFVGDCFIGVGCVVEDNDDFGGLVVYVG